MDALQLAVSLPYAIRQQVHAFVKQTHRVSNVATANQERSHWQLQIQMAVNHVMDLDTLCRALQPSSLRGKKSSAISHVSKVSFSFVLRGISKAYFVPLLWYLAVSEN